MNLNKAKTLSKVLLVISCIALIFGVYRSVQAGKARAHNPKSINIELTDMRSGYEEGGTGRKGYYVYFDYQVTNKTSADLSYVEFVTTVKNKKGEVITSIRNTYRDGAGVGKGKKVEFNSNVSNSAPREGVDDAFITLYESDKKDLQFSYEITSASWSDGYNYYHMD